MASRVKVLKVSQRDRDELERRMRSQTGAARDAQRARIVLLAAEGLPGVAIAERVGCSEPTVILWRRRYAQRGLGGLDDGARSGRPPTIDAAKRSEILARTLLGPPPELGVTHWSSRLLAKRVGVHPTTVSRLWAEHGIQPCRLETFKFSADPQLEAKVRDVVRLYLHPPEHAVVLCVDEKSQIQALDRTQPMLPVRPGLPARRTHDYAQASAPGGLTTLPVWVSWWVSTPMRRRSRRRRPGLRAWACGLLLSSGTGRVGTGLGHAWETVTAAANLWWACEGSRATARTGS